MTVFSAIIRTSSSDVTTDEMQEIFNVIEKALRESGHELRSFRRAFSYECITATTASHGEFACMEKVVKQSK